MAVKGVGERCAVAPPVIIANAVSDALAPFKAEFDTTSVMPNHLVRALALQVPHGCL
jgi:carbon-monoxide dehydrogenase large subunit